MYIKSINLVVINVYRQPDDPLGKHKSTSTELMPFITALNSYLDSISAPPPDIILCGDLNLPHADWSTGLCRSGASTDEKVMVEALHTLICNHFMTQLIDQATHRKGNTLDLLFSNNSDIMHSISSSYSGISDHYLIEVSVAYKTNQDKPKKSATNCDNAISFRTLNFFSYKIDWSSLCRKLKSHNWHADFKGCTAEKMMSVFCDTVLDICKDFVPLRRFKDNSESNNLIPRDRRILMRTRRRINIQLSKLISEQRRDQLMKKRIEIEKSLQKSLQNEADHEEKKALQYIKTNPKYFFAYAKRFSKIISGIGPLLNSSKTLTSDPDEMAEVLSSQYSSVFSNPKFSNEDPHKLFPDPPASQMNKSQSLTDIAFNELDIIEAIEELKHNSAAGPDQFPANLLYQCRHVLATPLCMIWRESLNTGRIPPLCKFANIIPIHKGKSKAEAKNYRPVALTSLLIKIFEKVIRKNIVSFMTECRLFNPSQHGFRSGRSCLSQLLAHFDRITRLLEEGAAVDVVYLDFAKAFDKVDIGIILRKLKSLGIGGKLGRWLHAFLLNRQQAVIVNGSQSTPAPVISGVPQGSVLGPLIFLVLIGDIDSEVASSFISSFADDTRAGHPYLSPEDAKLLQDDLNLIYQWAQDNNMKFNSDKFEHMHYSSKHTDQATPQYQSDIGLQIETKHVIRDLGVQMSDNATFTFHISSQCDKIRSKISWVLRTFRTREITPMLTLWKQLILGDHDYCSQLWNPTLVGDIQSLEMLQRSFLKQIRSINNLSYWEQLRYLRLYSLERRRERYIAIYTWKILEELVPNLSESASAISSKWHERRGRECNVPSVRTSAPQRIQTIRRASFGIRGPRLFNSLPKHIRNLRGISVNQFKAQLDRYLATIPDEPLIPGYTQFRKVASNSLLDWIPSHHRVEEGGAQPCDIHSVAEVSTMPR